MKKVIEMSKLSWLIYLMIMGVALNKANAQAPTITSFSPNTGTVGSLVTITGTNLSNPTSISIGGVNAIKISASADSLTALVMPGAISGSVNVTTNTGNVNSTNNFTLTTSITPNTQQGNKLVGTGSIGNASQGISVSLSADGNTAIVGGYADNSNKGAAWIYIRIGNTWTQQGNKLVGTGNIGGTWQGHSVSLSADGNTAIVGGQNDNNGQGATWVYIRSGNIWTQQGNKLVGTGNVGNAGQGQSVSLSADGNTAIVGGRSDNNWQGAAWIFTRSGNIWTQQGNKLVGTGSIGQAYQGVSVSLSADGNTAIVSGHGDNNLQGAVWIFTRSGNTWTQQGNKLVGTGNIGKALQGASVSLSADGNTAIVGGGEDNNGEGAVWIYKRSGNTWTQQSNKLAGTGNGFGYSLSLSADGNTAFIGAINDNNGQGAVWVYKRTGNIWTIHGNKLLGTGNVGSAGQGRSLSLSADGNTAIFGGTGDNNQQGAAWIFNAIPLNYNISAQTNSNGTVNPSGNINIAYGASQRILFTPNPGYVIDSVVVNGIKLDSIVGYTFNNVTSNQSIRVTFKCQPTQSITNLTIPSTSLPYTWNGLTFNNSGSQTALFTKPKGCDSIATLNLTVAFSIPNYIPTNGLVGYWAFNGNAIDESGNGNNGTVNGAILTNDRNGNVNKAYLFNGTSLYNGTSITANINTTSINNSQEYSISFWVFQTTFVYHTSDYYLTFGSWGNNGMLGFSWEAVTNGLGSLDGVGSLIEGENNIGNWSGYGYFNYLNFLNNWNNIIFTVKAGQAKTYFNGVLIATNVYSGQPSLPSNARFSSLSNGRLDDIGIWNRALNQTEITQLYTNCKVNSSITNLTIPSTSLPYTWNGLTFNAAGSQTKNLTNVGGCDSTATLNLTVINTTLPSYLPANGLVAWYPFNGNANDEGGNNYNLSAPITIVSDTNRYGSLNNAKYFEGTATQSKYNLPIGAMNSFNNLQSGTVSLWLKIKSLDVNGHYFQFDNIFMAKQKHGSNSQLMVGLMGNTTKIRFHLSGGLPSSSIFASNTSLNLNQWYHIVVSWNGINQKIYINGNLDNSISSGQTLVNMTNADYFSIGACEGIGSNGAYSTIDDIGFWNRELNQTEITNLFENTTNLYLSAFLEGTFNGGNMNATLNKINASISNSIADSIIVELHSSASPYATIYSSNGVVNTNGTATIAFPNSAIGSSYYIAIKHRNSIETWSAAPVVINNNTIYNFTTSASQAYGANLSNMGEGVFGIYSGDINQDGSIDFADYPALDVASQNGVLGYDSNDLNGDASVDFGDYPLLDMNSSKGIFSIRP